MRFPVALLALSVWLAPGLQAQNADADRRPIPDKLVVLTFDDANKSDRKFVAGVLKKYGFGATFYVTEGLGFLKNKDHYITWEEIRELHDMGFEIGNHTQHHRNVRSLSDAELKASIEHIEKRCDQYGIPKPTTFCYPGFQNRMAAVRVLEEKGYLFARRGVGPEFPDSGSGAPGPIYDPAYDHPLLIPSTGYDGPNWNFEHLKNAVARARNGKIAVLCFHGVPALEHPWVNTDPADFERYMKFLKDQGCTVIAMRDLAHYVDPDARPGQPYNRMEQRARQPYELVSRPIGNPLGLDLPEAQLEWSFRSSNFVQSAWQVLVSTSREKLAANAGDLWDSGKVHGGTVTSVPYQGLELPRGKPVWWKVRAWDSKDVTGLYSDPAPMEFAAKTSLKPRKRHAVASGKVNYTEGRHGQGITLAGNQSVITISHYAGLHPTRATTLSAWIRPANTSDEWKTIYRKEDGSGRRLLAIGRTGDIWGLWVGFGIDDRYVEYGAPYPPDKLGDKAWHHVAATFDGQAITLYVDGKSIGSRKAPGVLGLGGSAPAHIGSYGAAMEPFQGGIDDFRIYNRALNASEIRQLVAAEEAPDEAEIAGWWKLDGNLENEVTFTPQSTGNCVAFLGNRMTADMAVHGYLETALTVLWPRHDITFRNLGWPADNVFGIARSEFGSGKNTRSWQPPGAQQGFGYRTLMEQVNDARPSTIFIAYGSETAFYETAEQFDRFKAGYLTLLDDLGGIAANFILVSPHRQEILPPPFPDVAGRNQRLKATTDFIRLAAAKGGHTFVDLFNTLIPDGAQQEFTENGIHLNAQGHARLTRIVLDQLKLSDRFRHAARFSKEGHVHQAHGARIQNIVPTAKGFRFDFTPAYLPSLADPKPTMMQIDAPQAAFQLRADGRDAGRLSYSDEAHFLPVNARHRPRERVEELRQVIFEKNQLYKYRLRPLNKTYIFLFRRHEMGHLAYEMDDFERLASEKEELIARLRTPVTERFVVENLEPWRSPRNYPDHEVPRDIPAPDLEAEMKAFTLAKDYDINLFAANPMIANPINMNWDTRGRLWVATSSTYPHIKPGRQPNDRIVILEDNDHDGRADKSTVFAEGLLVPQSVMPVPGGAYVCSATRFLFLPDPDQDDRANSVRVVYNGFGNADVHHMIHGLRWAPWGELFFTQSIYINSFIETPWGFRRLNGSGIWRFRPESERLEIFARGMVNPWGHAFDPWGISFATDGAGGSGPHFAFAGAAFPTAVGAPEVLRGLIPGKPKNTGAEFVSGRHATDAWQGSLLANDFRANRTVRYALKESGSGYTAEEVETVIHSKHRSFRPVDIKMGPEGAIYVIDWYNPIIDHGEVDFHHPQRDKSHGRIWRLTAKGRPLLKRPVIAGAPVAELLEHLKAPEEWTRVQAKRELASRGADKVLPALNAWLGSLDSADPHIAHHQLEALWLCGSLRSPNPALLKTVAASEDYHARAAATRMMYNWHNALPEALSLLGQAVADEHPRVRLMAVNALREIGTLEAANLALRALDFPQDKNLQFALRLTARELQPQWLPALQAGTPVFDGRVDRVSFALNTATDKRALAPLIELIREGKAGPDALRIVTSLGGPEEMELAFDLALRDADPALLQSLAEATRSNPAVPSRTGAVTGLLNHKDESVRKVAAELVGRWKVADAKALLLKRAGQKNCSSSERLALYRAVAELGAFDTLETLGGKGPGLAVQMAATAALAERKPAEAAPAATRLLTRAKPDADTEMLFRAFTARKEGPAALADALAETRLDLEIASAGVRVALASGLDMTTLVNALTRAGSLQPIDSQLSAAQRDTLLSAAKQNGNRTRGEAIFQRQSLACVTCHAINGKGGKVGPELGTLGTYMTPESILESLVNPNTSIKQGYETTVITLKDEELLTGTLQRKTDTAHLLRDATGRVISIPNKDIESVDASAVSLMPAGLTSALRRDELIDLLHYLTHLGK